MARRLAILVCVSLAAASACGSGDDQATSSVPTVTVGPTVPGSQPVADVEPQADELSLRYGSLTERSIDIDADGRNTTAAVAGMNRSRPTCTQRLHRANRATWW